MSLLTPVVGPISPSLSPRHETDSRSGTRSSESPIEVFESSRLEKGESGEIH